MKMRRVPTRDGSEPRASFWKRTQPFAKTYTPSMCAARQRSMIVDIPSQTRDVRWRAMVCRNQSKAFQIKTGEEEMSEKACARFSLDLRSIDPRATHHHSRQCL